MERKESMLIGDVMRRIIEESQMAERLDEAQAAESWPYVVGAEIARRSPRPTVRLGVMYVRIADAALRQELHLNRSRLCRSLNAQLGKNVIKEIRFTS